MKQKVAMNQLDAAFSALDKGKNSFEGGSFIFFHILMDDFCNRFRVCYRWNNHDNDMKAYDWWFFIKPRV